MVREAKKIESISRAERRRAERSERIVDAALQILSEEGRDALSMQRLAKGLGYAVGALYRYFPSKDALLVVMQRRAIEDLQSDVRRALRRVEAKLGRTRTGATPGPAIMRLLIATASYASLSERRPVHMLLIRESLADPRTLVTDEDARPLVPALELLLGTVAELFVEAGRAGALEQGDPLRRTAVLWGATHGALQLDKLDRLEAGAHVLRRDILLPELLTTLFRGWGAEDMDLEKEYARVYAYVIEALQEDEQ